METSLKTCRDCGATLPLTSFYAHSQMGDGHLNKCKRCVRDRVRRHRLKNVERIRKYDRMRYQRDEYRQRQYAELARNISKKRKRVYCMTSNAIRDGRLVRPSGCWHCGVEGTPEAHHTFYDPEHFDAVTWLCRSCHVRAHQLTKRVTP